MHAFSVALKPIAEMFFMKQTSRNTLQKMYHKAGWTIWYLWGSFVHSCNLHCKQMSNIQVHNKLLRQRRKFGFLFCGKVTNWKRRNHKQRTNKSLILRCEEAVVVCSSRLLCIARSCSPDTNKAIITVLSHPYPCLLKSIWSLAEPALWIFFRKPSTMEAKCQNEKWRQGFVSWWLPRESVDLLVWGSESLRTIWASKQKEETWT